MATPKFPGKKENMPLPKGGRGLGKATPMPLPRKSSGLPGGTNMSRMSADDKSRQNPVFKSVLGYGSNVIKEAKDFGRAWINVNQKGNEVGRGTDTAANKARKNQDAQMGQLLGAILQGRRYK